MHGVVIAIEYSYKLDRKNYFNLWCELGRLLLRQSHMWENRHLCIIYINTLLLCIKRGILPSSLYTARFGAIVLTPNANLQNLR